MNFKDWMEQKGYEVQDMAQKLCVNRSSIWKLRTGKAVCPELALKIRLMTGGKVKPKERPKGRPRG